MKLEMKAVVGFIVLVCSLAAPVHAYFVDNFDGTALNTAVWTNSYDLYYDPVLGYDWHPQATPTWTVGDGALQRDNSRPSMLVANFTPITFAENPVIEIQSRIKSLSSYNFEIGNIGQAGKKFTVYLNGVAGWAGSFPPDGTGYLLSPMFMPGPQGDVRPQDDWFDVKIVISKAQTPYTISLYVNGELKIYDDGDTNWLSGLSQIDTLTMTAAGVDPQNPWYVDYVRVVPEPASMALLAMGGLMFLQKRRNA